MPKQYPDGRTAGSRRNPAHRPLSTLFTLQTWVKNIRKPFKFDQHSILCEEGKVWRRSLTTVLSALEKRYSQMSPYDQGRLKETCAQEAGRIKRELATGETELEILQKMERDVDTFLRSAHLEERHPSPEPVQQLVHSSQYDPTLLPDGLDEDFHAFAGSGYPANSLSKLPLGLTPRKARFYGFV